MALDKNTRNRMRRRLASLVRTGGTDVSVTRPAVSSVSSDVISTKRVFLFPIGSNTPHQFVPEGFFNVGEQDSYGCLYTYDTDIHEGDLIEFDETTWRVGRVTKPPIAGEIVAKAAVLLRYGAS